MTNFRTLTPRFLILVLFLMAAIPVSGQKTGKWLPITPEELALKQSPYGGTAHAFVIFREDYTDDELSFNSHYYRIKILTEEGKRHANIEIPYVKGLIKVDDIKARTIRPDGTVVDFKGEVFDRLIVKSRDVKFQAKTFTFPDVQVGGMIEYRYTLRWDPNWLPASYWQLQTDLPTRRVRFVLNPYKRYYVNWMNFRVPKQRSAQVQKDGSVVLELEDVPAFEEEQFIPPERELKMRIEFFYTTSLIEKPDEFWKREGKEWNSVAEEFIGKRGGIERAAAEIKAGAATPEEVLRKIYARVQQIRNLSFEREKSEKEEKRENLKDNNNIEDVLKRGYGYRSQINRLFVGLARAAGFDTSVIRISERDTYFFHQNLQDARQLDGEVAVVRLGNEERYFDAGTPFCPFGFLSWEKTDVMGIRLAKDGGVFVNTPAPKSADAPAERKATLVLNEDGTLQGKVRLSFSGHQAMRRRLASKESDETGRKKDMEDELKEDLPSSAVVKLEAISDWEGSDTPLTVEYSIEVPGFAMAAGRRMLIPTGIFQTNRKNPYQHEARVHPVYFRFPYLELDEITVQLPEGYAVETLPAARDIPVEFGRYTIVREIHGQELRIKRRIAIENFFYPQPHYPKLRDFFSKVRAGDEEQAVLRPK